MKENGNGAFYSGQEAQVIYPEIIPVYRAAFAGEPWFEVTKCEDPGVAQKCIGGFSSQEIGQLCADCNLSLVRPAYESQELIDRFDRVSGLVPTAWYTEGDENGLNLAAFVWKANVDFIADEKYSDVPEMKKWLLDNLGDDPILWLDEIFADRTKKPSGNLANFRQMTNGFRDLLGYRSIAFRTINQRLIYGALKQYPALRLYEAFKNVPDRRSVVELPYPGWGLNR
jgi:hypothetical protein